MWTQPNKCAIPDITWWINKLAHNQPLRFTRPNKWIIFLTETSSSGSGAALIRQNQKKVFAYGEWKDNNLKSSNQRKVTVVLKSLLDSRQELIQQQHIGVRLFIDNTVTIYCINQGKESFTIALLVGKVLKLAEQHSGEFAFNREFFKKTLMKLGIQLHIDIFAIRANRQCTWYCSFSKDKFAVKQNGYELQWSKEVPLFHPPISQQLKTIRQVKKERVPVAVLIAPDWPNQKWFRELREITTQKICLQENSQVLLIGVKHRNKGWVLPSGLIYLFILEVKTEKIFSDNCYRLVD
ncbi:MAG: hypothetical protein EZS28_008637 [Streblomastix strix]|uniref:Uncharacterized protein n=1 Tax=Streblomastix strix TaxID=222440 RepID=A0A5J4WLA1_9EUKA|nr:MAG: hypothetical protein EZS28_008637 [Streblomastix strix]